jgi:DNA ligase (NAD+)
MSKRTEALEAVQFPHLCPECSTELIRKEGEANHYCPNEKGCPPQIKGKIEHYIQRKAMNIENIGLKRLILFIQKVYLKVLPICMI